MLLLLAFCIGFFGGLWIRGWLRPWKQEMDRLDIARLEQLCRKESRGGKPE